MIIKINQVIPYKMKGPNPAKFSAFRDSYMISILVLLQYGKVQVGSLQNGV